MRLRPKAKACGISHSSVARILHGGIKRGSFYPNQTGCPQKLSAKQLLCNLKKLREQNPSFSLKDLTRESCVSGIDVSVRTVNRFIQRQGYHSLFANTKEKTIDKGRYVQASKLL